MADILIVDDSDSVRRAIELLLRHQGHHVTSYADPASALRGWTERADADIVISDINMPHMQGPELLARMRAHHADAVYLGTTAHATIEQERAMYASGARLIIPKPAHVDGLLALVAYCGEHKRSILRDEVDLQGMFEANLHHSFTYR